MLAPARRQPRVCTLIKLYRHIPYLVRMHKLKTHIQSPTLANARARHLFYLYTCTWLYVSAFVCVCVKGGTSVWRNTRNPTSGLIATQVQYQCAKHPTTYWFSPGKYTNSKTALIGQNTHFSAGLSQTPQSVYVVYFGRTMYSAQNKSVPFEEVFTEAHARFSSREENGRDVHAYGHCDIQGTVLI